MSTPLGNKAPSGWYCNTCLDEMTVEEHHYYDDRCEKCERAWHERIERWRHGGEDTDLDALFAGESFEAKWPRGRVN